MTASPVGLGRERVRPGGPRTCRRASKLYCYQNTMAPLMCENIRKFADFGNRLEKHAEMLNVFGDSLRSARTDREVCQGKSLLQQTAVSPDTQILVDRRTNHESLA